jgi:hypothetical protein
VVSRRVSGRCAALEWDANERRYGCGVLMTPGRWLRVLGWLPTRWSQALVARWIAAGRGCDADLESG